MTRDGAVSVPPEKQYPWQSSKTSWGDCSTWRGGSWASNTPYQAAAKEVSNDNEDAIKDGALLSTAAAPGWERSAEEASTTVSHGNSDVAELVPEGLGQATHVEGQISETDSVVASLPNECQKLQEFESELLEERRCRERVEAELKEERLHSKQLEAQLAEERCRREELERRLAENDTRHPEVCREVVTDAHQSACTNAVDHSSPELPSQTHRQEEPVKDEHPHQKEEWYQKWLRRQENKSRQVVEIGQPPEAEDVQTSKGTDHENEPSVTHQNVEGSEKRVCPDDGKKYTFEELQVAFGKEYTAEDLKSYWKDAMKVEGAEVAPPEPATKGYEHEEWYQKWLRRQKNKSRQIIEIG